MLTLMTVPENTVRKLEDMNCTLIGYMIASNRVFIACVMDNRATPFVTWEVLPSGELHQGDYVTDRPTAFHRLHARTLGPSGAYELEDERRARIAGDR